MKIYQVYSGDTDKHGRQTKDYLATYLDKEKALEHCHEIVNKLKLQGEDIKEGGWGNEGGLEKGIIWTAVGLEYVNICYLYERFITK